MLLFSVTKLSYACAYKETCLGRFRVSHTIIYILYINNKRLSKAVKYITKRFPTLADLKNCNGRSP